MDDLTKLVRAVDFFLEDGIAEDHPDLNLYAYERLVKAFELRGCQRKLHRDGTGRSIALQRWLSP